MSLCRKSCLMKKPPRYASSSEKVVNPRYTRYITKSQPPIPGFRMRPSSETMIGHGAAALEMGIGAVAEEGAPVIDADSLHIFEAIQILV